MNKISKTFYFLCFVFVCLLINSFFLIAKEISPLNNYSSVFNPICVIIELKKESDFKPVLKVNNEFINFENKNNQLKASSAKNIKSLDILIEKELEQDIKNIVVFNDTKLNYFKDFSSFKKSDYLLCNSKGCKNYLKYEFPKSVKYNENSSSYNFKSYINIFSAEFLSCFVLKPFIFLPFLFLIFITFYFVKNKNEISLPKINSWLVFALIFAAGSLIRFNELFSYPLELDESASIYFSDPKKDIWYTFDDAGNPPLFYLMLRLWLSAFNVSLVSAKLFPFIISLFGSFFLWLFLKKEFSLKTANLGLFLASVNLPLIYFSNEVRSYILQAAIVPFIVYVLFKIIDTNKPKYYVFYAVLAAIISNIHYYGILLLISNFLYLTCFFIYKKRGLDILKFFIANLYGILFFIPYFFGIANENALNNTNFNDWIPKVSIGQIKTCLMYIFGGGVSFILSLVFFLKNLFKENSKEKRMVIYSFSIIVLTFLLSVIFSLIIRPLMVERYYILILPLFIIFLTCIFTSKYKNKYAVILFILWFFIIQTNAKEPVDRRYGIINHPLSISYYYENKDKNIYVVTNQSEENLKFGFEKFIKKDVNYVQDLTLSAEKTVYEILDKDKNAVIFTSLIQNPKSLVKNAIHYYNPATKSILYKVEN